MSNLKRKATPDLTPNQSTKTRRSTGPEIGIDDAERSIPTPISLSDSNDENEDMDEDGDVLMGSPDADAGTEENPIELTDDDDLPAATGKESGEKENGKGKMSPRRVWGLHVQQLTELWGDDDDEGVIRGFKQESDDTILFTLPHPSNPSRTLSITLMCADTSSYLHDHQFFAYTDDDVSSSVSEVLAGASELGSVPVYEASAWIARKVWKSKSEDVDLQLVMAQSVLSTSSSSSSSQGAGGGGDGGRGGGKGKTRQALTANSSRATVEDENDAEVEDESDEDHVDEYLDDEYFDIKPRDGKAETAMKLALKRDFLQISASGYRPGFTRINELDNVISVSVKVGTLDIPLSVLEAWDAKFRQGGNMYLTLLINIGASYPLDIDRLRNGDVKFAVGLGSKYKPSKEAVTSAFRAHSSRLPVKGEGKDGSKADFEPFSVGQPLAALMKEHFVELVKFRRRPRQPQGQTSTSGQQQQQGQTSSRQQGQQGQQQGQTTSVIWHSGMSAARGKAKKVRPFGWAGAERVCLGKVGEMAGVGVVDPRQAEMEDEEEDELAGTYNLPDDPLRDPEYKDNFPLVAFSYLVRRFKMCPRFCLVCHRGINSEVQALKPYVCGDQLCLYQYMSVGLGPSIDYEIVTNGPAVDLLVQFAYHSAGEGEMKEYPDGIHLQAPKPGVAGWKPGDEEVDFDGLLPEEKGKAVTMLLDQLPSIASMKSWLEGENMTDDERHSGKIRKLKDIDGGKIPESAFKLLRWIIASNTSYLRVLSDPDEMVHGLPGYTQFRFVTGSPDKEHKLKLAIQAAQARCVNAKQYPTLFAFHGSGARNWHAIIREGLHFKKRTNGRAFGDGVYFAKDGALSVSTYASPSTSMSWKNAENGIVKVMALCEIVNLPNEFTSKTPHLVVQHLDWIQARYLIVQHAASTVPQLRHGVLVAGAGEEPAEPPTGEMLPMDPEHQALMLGTKIYVPAIAAKLAKLEGEMASDTEFDLDDTDHELMEFEPGKESSNVEPSASPSQAQQRKETAADEPPYEPCAAEVLKHVTLIPPPTRANPMALSVLAREVKAMVKMQEEEPPSTRGWYYDPDTTDDNLFQWVVELFGFDPELPLAKDMKARGVKAIVMEVRFSQNFPFAPPFFRVISPRFLPFINGGGGHVTGGGSMCMDLLTSSGWISTYSVASILLQIRMAMSNLEPRPARLHPDHWNQPYTVPEAVAGFKRAAATHGWEVPKELEEMTKYK